MKKAKRIILTILCSIAILGSLAFSLPSRNKIDISEDTYAISEIIVPSSNKGN